MKLAPRLRRSTRVSVAFLVFNLDGMGGTSRSTVTQANALARRGNVEVRLVSVTRSAATPHYAIDPAVGVHYLVDARDEDPRATRPSRLIPARWDGQFSELTDDGLNALKSLDVDLVVTVTPALMAAAVQLLPADTKVLHQEHRSSADRVGGMEPLLAFAPRVAAVALLTRSTAAWLGSELGSAAPEIVVMPNPLPVTEQPASSLDSKTIVAAGRIVAEKQFIHLLRAFEQVAADLPDWRLRILGDGPLRAELAAHAAKVGLADRVELPGAVPDMAPEWAAAAICALSSKTEGFPLVAQEAMSAGVPVVTYDCPSGPRELVEHGVSGLLVGAGSKAGLAAALHDVARDPELRARLGAGALAASRRYDADAIAAEWETIFSRLCADQRTPAAASGPFTRDSMPLAVPPITPREARQEALSLAIAAADAAGPGWFVIPTHDNPAPTVVVPAAHRPAVLAGLADVPDHFSLLDPGDRGWPVRRLPARSLVEALHGAAPNRVVLEPWPRSQGVRSVLGEDAGVEIEFWDRLPDGTLVPPRPNRWVRTVPPGTQATEVTVADVKVPTLELMAAPTPFDVTFPVDAVYTWVDGDDPGWNAARAAREDADTRREVAGRARFRSRDELRYSLRSLHLFAPWVRHIHIVTAGQRPSWLADHPGITLVDHRDILPPDALPTFNSQAIETALHKIPGLAEHFIYVNDDVFLARPSRPERFFSPGGAAAAFVGEAPIGLPGTSDKPFLQAALNNRALLEDAFGVQITQVMAHSPHPQRVSVLAEIETRFPDAVARTARAPFRSETDVSLLSSLAQHYGLLTGTAFPATAKQAFVDLSNARVERQLKQLRARDHDFFCVGDHHEFAVDAAAVDAMLAGFLADYFPLPAPWEH
ncbi:stealth conserved region 3 domain-containing protein [Nocardioides sp.]|uniref:stealth conserved region 3 domain-containing protein n=1 Tax=Nocardioides sp. TaxID=35761 RepID=UPI002BD67070|nr:stealth conserved region 3 domain-containing protein [Nocardioides sp.]HXH79034.1 stealth conserved region 3 domain-containing protein [Nocardioides sp.]